MKIGVFDSGYGGLTVLKDILSYLPQYDYVYLGDNARTPYGTRSFEIVYKYTLQAVKKLFELDCQLVILACNTASAKALRTIQQNDLPKIAPTRRVLGVIRPTIEIIDKYTKSNNVGILATPGTVASESYKIEINKFFPHIDVYQQACPMWVPLVENNEHLSVGADFFVEKYIKQLYNQKNNIDAIILACTHYPLLKQKILKYTTQNTVVLSQGEIVAKSLKDYLTRHQEIESKLAKTSKYDFFTTDRTEVFDKMTSIFLSNSITINSQKIELEKNCN